MNLNCRLICSLISFAKVISQPRKTYGNFLAVLVWCFRNEKLWLSYLLLSDITSLYWLILEKKSMFSLAKVFGHHKKNVRKLPSRIGLVL